MSTATRPATGVRTPNGFTLIELAVTIVLLSVVLMAGGGLLMALSAGGQHSRNRTTATFHAQRHIERLYELDYANLASGQSDTTLANGSGIRTAWTVSQLVPGRLAQVDVTVRRIPGGPGGAEQAMRLFIANRNP
jgi:prepilin-type N-terminal cleavage/methylation domain-containing protein